MKGRGRVKGKNEGIRKNGRVGTEIELVAILYNPVLNRSQTILSIHSFFHELALGFKDWPVGRLGRLPRRRYWRLFPRG